ncbi:MAG TPA: fatty acid desaturase [Flavobacteriales bacterium]|nr:fatty acid desaturase [Flavobacteriales bacterium]
MSQAEFPKYRQEAALFREINARVSHRVKAIKEDRSRYMKAKAIILPVLYFGCYFTALFSGDRPGLYTALFVIMGLTVVLIYLNLVHEAAHNSIYQTKKYNRWVMRLFDLVGANSYIWEKRHMESHHHYPNVEGWDTDMAKNGPIKVYPHGEAKGMQKYQDKYIFFIYPLYLFNWMLLRDFRDFFGKDRIIQRVHGPIPSSEKVKLILFKAFYFFYQIAVPVLFFQVSLGLAFGAWALQILVASVFALFVLLPLHPLPDNAFPLPDDHNMLPYSWLRHQLEVTNDLRENNWFIRHVLGNFNFHVVHHLFPMYSYPYYKEVTEELVAFAREKNLPYKRIPLLTALHKHYQLLRMNARNQPLRHVFEHLDS